MTALANSVCNLLRGSKGEKGLQKAAARQHPLRGGSWHGSPVSSLPQYLARPGAPSVAQPPRKPAGYLEAQPRPWSSQAPFCPSAGLSHTHLSNSLRPICNLGTRKLGRGYLLPYRPLLPASPGPDRLLQDPLYTHFHHHSSAIAAATRPPQGARGPGTGCWRQAHWAYACWEPALGDSWAQERESTAWAESRRKSPKCPHLPGKSTRARRRSPPGTPRAHLPDARAPEPAPAAAPSAPAQLAARLTDASSPPAVASGVFVYIRARRPALRRRVCHRLAIILTHACGSAGSWFGRGTLAFLSAGAAASPLPPGVYLLYPVSGTGWVLQQSVPSPRRSRFASLSPGERNYLFIYVPRLVLARRSRGRRGRRVEGRRGC